MTGKDYADLVAAYLLFNYGDRHLEVYREVAVGKSIIGKNRRIDLLLVHEPRNRAFAIECKYQEQSGTVDEKIPYALQDMKALRMPGCVAYGGGGFSPGVLHLLQGSELAAHCEPSAGDLRPNRSTWELDHILAMQFHWWDILLRDKKPYTIDKELIGQAVRLDTGIQSLFSSLEKNNED